MTWDVVKIHILFFFFNKVIYFQLCWVFVAAHRFSLVVVCGLLVAVASLVAEHRLQSSQALVGFVVHGLNCPVACGIFSDQGLNPCSLH